MTTRNKITVWESYLSCLIPLHPETFIATMIVKEKRKKERKREEEKLIILTFEMSYHLIRKETNLNNEYR